MKLRDEELDRIVDEALGQLREARLEPELERKAAERVWQRLAAEVPAVQAPERHEIRSCEDFRALIDPYLRGELNQARALLVRDHFGECVPCRRALKARRETLRRPVVGSGAHADGGWRTRLGWRVAAAAVIFVGVWGLSFKTDVLSFESGGLVRVDRVEGELFKMTDRGPVPVAAGETVDLERGQGIQTAKGSTAVLRLSDDSQVEMRERSQLAVLERNYLVPGRRDDGKIDLERGSIIVEASDQGSGHLYVDTQDCKVSVTGTVFSVNHGIKGSRVSVIEGQVRVAHGGTQDILAPGEQTTTSAALEAVPVEDEIAWSRKRDQYVALLREVRALSREIEQVLRPGLRYSTDLLDLAPADTVIYVTMPNVSNGLGEAWELLQARVATNPVLHDWWAEQRGDAPTALIDEVFDKIRTYGDQLGEEILLTVQLDGREMGEPLFLTRVKDAAVIGGLLRDDLARLHGAAQDGPSLTLLEGTLPAAAPEASGDMFFWIHDGLLAASPAFDRLRTLDSIRRGQYVSLANGPFHDRLAERYDQGVEWLVGVDLEQLVGLADDPQLAEFGFADVQFLIAERRQQGAHVENRADLTFAQPRRRLAAWLAEPAPLGSLDYVSPDANLVAAFAMKDLGALVDELFQMIGSNEPGFWDELGRFEAEHGIDIRRDIAAPLGGEFALALDGPVLPSPSWKLVLEVYDPGRLQQTITALVEQVNLEAAGHGIKGLALERDESAGRSYLRITSLDTGLEVQMVFDGGYVIAAPSRALVQRALQTRASGVHLVESPGFRALLPTDAEVNFSGLVYHDLGPLMAPLSGAFHTLTEMGAEDRAFWEAATGETLPGLALVYGEKDRISVVSTSEGGLLTSGLNSLTGFGGLLGMQQSLIEGLAEQARSAQ